ncbi:MAG: pyridoxamine 5'-phosphate oxidase family protein [Gammaproteobacteria bacterium]|nr:pyridoxamine 5'-phosphate oxidase family protein [Gammaproteobacteria bacterium]
MDHEGERAAHKRFGVEGLWQAYDFNSAFRATLAAGTMRFVESLPFFFIATANRRGECDCSFRGREYDAAGRPYALVKVLDPKTLMFPDYGGNRYFNSLGNILVNGQIGMLFVDFNARRRLRINGRASIVEDRSAYAHWWPLAERYVRVDVTQVFENCRARIPRMTLIMPTDSELQDE